MLHVSQAGALFRFHPKVPKILHPSGNGDGGTLSIEPAFFFIKIFGRILMTITSRNPRCMKAVRSTKWLAAVQHAVHATWLSGFSINVWRSAGRQIPRGGR